MINFVNYIEIILKNREKSEKKWKKSEKLYYNYNKCYSRRKIRNFGTIIADAVIIS
jgi:Txe/YoeB family toxin of Txe-Axe toxin-antitoxin module